MERKSKFAMVLLFSAFFALCNMNLYAQEGSHGFPGGHKGPGGGNVLELFRSLSLTSDQQSQLKSILDSQKSVFDTNMEAMKTAESNFVTYLKNGGSDSSEIESLSSSLAVAIAAMKSQEANIFVSFYGSLTDSQKSTLAAFQTPGPGPER